MCKGQVWAHHPSSFSLDQRSLIIAKLPQDCFRESKSAPPHRWDQAPRRGGPGLRPRHRLRLGCGSYSYRRRGVDPSQALVTPGRVGVDLDGLLLSTLDAIGGVQSPGGSCAWHVLGLETPLKNLGADSQAGPGRPHRQNGLTGILVADLGFLKSHYIL